LAQKTLDITANGPAVVGQSFSITVTGTSTLKNLTRLSIFANGVSYQFDNLGWKNCDSSFCNSISAIVNYTAQYPGSVLFETYLADENYNYTTSAQLVVNVVCAQEYCAPDPVMENFTAWMRNKHYTECIISEYNKFWNDPAKNSAINSFLKLKPGPTAQTMDIDFYDIVPIDAEATYLSLGSGEGGNCQPNPLYPSFCPSPIPADYLFLQNHFRRTFGIEINFIYHRIEISYAQTFGQPVLLSSGLYQGTYQFSGQSTNDFITNLGAGRYIVHWAIQTWNTKFLADMSGDYGRVAELDVEPFNLFGAASYTHEWGHALGLYHTFVTPNNQGSFALDGIMGNTYVGSSPDLLDVLDPLERYVLEPVGNYIDSAAYVQQYNTGIVGANSLLPVCKTVDPEIVSAQLLSSDATSYTFQLTLSNAGNILVGYVKLGVFDGDHNGPLIKSRTIQSLLANVNATQQFTVLKSDISSTCSVEFFLDYLNEVAGENENNNQSVVNLFDTPINLASSNITTTSEKLTWTDISGTGNYSLDYKVTGNANWTTVGIQGQTFYQLNGLIPGISYDVRVKRICGNVNSAYTNVVIFNTMCPTPQNLSVSNITDVSANFTWTDPAGTDNYYLQYRNVGTALWANVYISSQITYLLNNLNPSTDYEARLYRRCGTISSDFTNSIFFKTKFCTSKGQNSTSDWIDLVQLSTLNNPSGNDGGYKDYTSLIPPDLSQTKSYVLNFSASASTLKRNRYWSTWIDFNQDGDFLDAGEQIMTTSSISTGTLTANFTIPANAVLGYTRMRISMKYSSALTGPCEVFSNGEVEDYSINIADQNGGVIARIKTSSSAQNDNNSATQEIESGKLYPNPVKDLLHLDLLSEYKGGSMVVTDALGKTIYNGDFKDQLVVSEWTSGVYLITLQKGAQASRFRVMKE